MSVAPSLSSLSNPTSNSSSESLMKNKNKDAMTSSFVVLPPRMKKSTNSKKSTTTSSSTTTPTTTNTNTNTNTRMNSGLTAELLKNTPGNKMDLTSSFVIASQDDYEFVSSNPTSSFASLTASAVSTLPNSAVVSPAPSSIASSTSSYFFAALEKHNAGNKLTSSASSRPSSIMSFEAPPAKYRPGRTISRRAQRLANLCFLLDGEVDEKDFTYLEAPQQTQFAWLLEDEQRLQKWLDFVSQPEEKQKQILFGKEKDTSSKVPPTVHIFPTADSSQCYLRIERRVREMLRKANIPKEF